MSYPTDILYSLFLVVLQVCLLFLFSGLGIWYVIAKLRKGDTHSAWFKRLCIIAGIGVLMLMTDFIFGANIRDFLISVFGYSEYYCPSC